MALVACKECGHKISKKAKSCPNCGAKPRRTGFTVKLILVILGLVFLGKVFGDPKPAQIASTELTPQQKRAKAEEEKKSDRASLGAYALRKAMRNPESFKLESVLVIDKTNAVCYEYRAENGFGGTNFERAVLASDGSTFKNESMAGFPALWNKECASKTGKDYTRNTTATLGSANK